MLSILKYYFNPLILTVGAAGYFSPFLIGLPTNELLRFLVGNVIAALMLLFIASALMAWIVAGVQAIMAIVGYRKQNPFWKHHLNSVAWTVACYLVVISLLSNGYYLTA